MSTRKVSKWWASPQWLGLIGVAAFLVAALFLRAGGTAANLGAPPDTAQGQLDDAPGLDFAVASSPAMPRAPQATVADTYIYLPLVLRNNTPGPAPASPLIDFTVSIYRPVPANEREAYNNIMGYFADAIYEMSNGAHKIGTITIYQNSENFWTTNVQWAAEQWPRANTNTYGGDGRVSMGDVFPFPTPYNVLLPDNQRGAGYTLGHEWGHYYYGLYDEYKGSAASSDRLASPIASDIPVENSVMDNQWRADSSNDFNWLNFSTPQFTLNGQGKTGQDRVFGASGWETLARPPAQDPRDGLRWAYPDRLYYPELAAVAPQGNALPSIELPAAAARSDLQINWEEPARSSQAAQATVPYFAHVESITGQAIVYPQPALLVASAAQTATIARAGLTAQVTAPGGLTATLQLKDDGVAPDVIAEDGRYSGFMLYHQDGVHTVTAVFDNHAGQAVFTELGAEAAPGPNGEVFSPTMELVGQDFVVTATLAITVSNFQADDYGNDSATATTLAPNNTDLDGQIDAAGDKDVFRVTAATAGTLGVRVTNLALGMTPRLRLLDADGLTVIQEVTAIAPGHNYYFASLPVQAGDIFYVEISHQNGDATAGLYSVSVGAVLPGDVLHTLTIATLGDGSGVVTPTVGAHTYPTGTVITLMATPDPGSVFDGWLSDEGENDCDDGVVTMDMDKVCYANFSLANTGLILHWTFEEGAGTVTQDQTANDLDGSIFGTGYAWSTEVPPGSAGHSIYLGGIGPNDYVSSTASALFPSDSSPRTLCAWAKSEDGIVDGGADHIVNYGGFVVGEPFGAMIFTSSTNHWYFYGAGSADIDTGIVADTAWHHHCVTYDSTVVRYYLDGTQVVSDTRALITTVNTPFLVGARPDFAADRYFDGWVDDVRLYERALSAAEVDELHTGLILHWTFEEGSGTVTHDQTANNLDGTMFGSGYAWSTEVPPGSTGHSIYLGGIGPNDYVSSTASALFPSDSSPRTLCAWAKSEDGIVDGGADHIVNYGGFVVGEPFGAMIFTSSTNHWYFYGAGSADIDTGIVADTAWHHHCVTYDSTVVRYYLDGTQVVSDTRALITTVNTPFLVGARPDFAADRYFDGWVDDVRLYDRALSAAEIAELLPTFTLTIATAGNGSGVVTPTVGRASLSRRYRLAPTSSFLW